jgi:hypothetical protein
MVELRFRDVEIRHPDTSQLVGRGSFGPYSHDRALMCQRNGDGSIRIYVLLRTPESWVDDCGIDFSVPQNAREGLPKHFEDWNEGLKALISECDDQGIIGRPLYSLPIGYSWAAKQSITPIGDSAHLIRLSLDKDLILRCWTHCFCLTQSSRTGPM